MDEHEFKNRTRQFGLRVIRLVKALPDGKVEDVLGKQFLRSATSVGANYRAACRAKSNADMIAKLSIVEEEADEAVYWLELLTDAEILKPRQVNALIAEGDELVAMTVASIKTLRAAAANPKLISLRSTPPGLPCGSLSPFGRLKIQNPKSDASRHR